MPRQISEEKRREYEELKKLFVQYMTYLGPSFPVELSHPSHPVNVLLSFEKDLGISRTLTGLKQAINDILEGSEELTPTEIAAADVFLSQAGAITLTEALRRRSRLYKSILKRGKIRNDTEFYLVSAILADTTLSLPEPDVLALNSFVLAYESRMR